MKPCKTLIALVLITLIFEGNLLASETCTERYLMGKLDLRNRAVSVSYGTRMNNYGVLLSEDNGAEGKQEQKIELGQTSSGDKACMYGKQLGFAYGGAIACSALDWALFGWPTGGYPLGYFVLSLYIAVPIGATIGLKLQKDESANTPLMLLGSFCIEIPIFLISLGIRESYGFLIFSGGLILSPLVDILIFNLTNNTSEKITISYSDNKTVDVGFFTPQVGVNEHSEMRIGMNLIDVRF